jgi:hypothetical protein
MARLTPASVSHLSRMFDRFACDAVELLSRFNAANVARERALEVFRPEERLTLCASRFACARVFEEAPRFGGGNRTPARRAFDSPMAIACCGDCAPCFPSRMWCISSRTNSPACVLDALPSSLSRRARSITFSSGIFYLRAL